MGPFSVRVRSFPDRERAHVLTPALSRAGFEGPIIDRLVLAAYHVLYGLALGARRIAATPRAPRLVTRAERRTGVSARSSSVAKKLRRRVQSPIGAGRLAVLRSHSAGWTAGQIAR